MRSSSTFSGRWQWARLWWPSRGRRGGILGLSVAGAVISASLMVVLYRGSNGYERVYFGTDTRIGAMLMGAALAALVAPGRSEGGLHRRFTAPLSRAGSSRSLLELAGSFSVLGLAYAYVTVPQDSSALYRGLLPLTGVAVATVIAAVAHPEERWLAALFSIDPLRWLGTISYGLYLWHWPIFLALDEARTGLGGPSLAVLRVVVSVGVATVSLHVIESPVRQGRLPMIRATSLPSLHGTRGLVVATSSIAIVFGALSLLPSGATGELSPLEVAAPRHDALQVMVVGDSLAGDFAAGLVSADERGDLRVSDLHYRACGLFPTDRTKVSGEKIVETEQICTERPQRWVEQIETGVDLVVLSSSRWDGAYKEVDGVWTHPCAADFHERYDNAVAESVRLLSGGHRPVAVVTSMDNRGVDGDTWTDCVNDVYRDLAAVDPLVHLIDVDDFLCEHNHCFTEREGVDLMRDEFHFSLAGAEYVARELILPALLTIAEASSSGAPDTTPLAQGGSRDPQEADQTLHGEPESLAFAGRNVLFVGDSIFGELTDGFEQAYGGSLRAVDRTLGYCGVLKVAAAIIGQGDRLEPTLECANVQASWEHALEEFEPEVVLLSASRWDATYKDFGDGASVSPCEAPSQAKHRVDLEAAVSRFQAHGAAVAIVTLPDHRSAANTFTDCVNDVYRAVAADDPHLQLLDLDRRMCPDHLCSPILTSGEAAVDGLHFTRAGRVEIGEWLRSELSIG